MAISSNLAGVARVAFSAETGEFNRDVAVAEARYKSATQGMSDGSIRLQLAQERLRRALAKGPAAYQSIARAELAVRRETAALNGELTKHSKRLDENERAIGRFSRGALAGSGLMRGLGRSVAFASSAFLGGAGLLYVLKSAIEAGREEAAALARTRNALADVKLSWKTNGKAIDENATKLSDLSGFTKSDVLGSFSLLVRSTKDVTEAMKLNALAIDVARARNISLETTTKLITRASQGQARGLAALGVSVHKGETAMQLLAAITEKYHGAAAAVTNPQERFNAALHNTEAAIGTALLPTVNTYLGKAADWLSSSRNQEKIQRDVTKAVATTSHAVRGLAGVLKSVKAAIDPVVKAMGGIERTAKAAMILGLVVYVRRAATSFGLISAASGLTRTKVIADAEAMEVALDAATRPRNIVITTTGGAGGAAGAAGAAGAGAAGAGAAAGGAGRLISRIFRGKGGTSMVERINQYGVKSVAPLVEAGVPAAAGGVLGALGGFAVFGVGASGGGVEQREPLALLYKNGKWYLDYGNGGRIQVTEAQATKYNARAVLAAKGLLYKGKTGKGSTFGTTPLPARTGGSTGGGGGSGDGLSRLQRLQLAVGDAENTKGVQDDLKANRALEAYYANIVKNGKLHGDDLFKARQDLQNQQQRVQSIEDGIASDRQQAAEKAAAKRKDAAGKLAATHKAAAAYRKKNIDAVRKALDTNVGPYANTSQGFANKKPVGSGLDGKASKTAAQDFAKLSFEFLNQLQGVTNQYSPNVTVNQNFATPTPDQHRETIYMRKAVESSYQTHGF